MTIGRNYLILIEVELDYRTVSPPSKNPAEFDRLPATAADLRNPMTSRKQKSVPYAVGYGKPPLHTRFRKGQSGNPGGRPRRTVTARAKALALREAYRTVTVKEGDRTLALPAIQAILRSQVVLAAKGNVQAQRAVLAAIQTIEQENVEAAARAERSLQAQRATLAAIPTIEQEHAVAAAFTARNTCGNMSYTEAARRVESLLGLDQEVKLKSVQDREASGVAPAP